MNLLTNFQISLFFIHLIQFKSFIIEKNSMYDSKVNKLALNDIANG